MQYLTTSNQVIRNFKKKIRLGFIKENLCYWETNWQSASFFKYVSHRDGKIDDKVSGRVDAINDPQPSWYREFLALQQLVNAHASHDLNDPKIFIHFSHSGERQLLYHFVYFQKEAEIFEKTAYVSKNHVEQIFDESNRSWYRNTLNRLCQLSLQSSLFYSCDSAFNSSLSLSLTFLFKFKSGVCCTSQGKTWKFDLESSLKYVY